MSWAEQYTGDNLPGEDAVQALLFNTKLLTRAEVEKIVRDTRHDAYSSGYDDGYADGAIEHDS